MAARAAETYTGWDASPAASGDALRPETDESGVEGRSIACPQSQHPGVTTVARSSMGGQQLARAEARGAASSARPTRDANRVLGVMRQA